MGNSHVFSIKLAEKYNVYKAILIQHIDHWLFVNQSNKVNFKEGRTWTYDTSITYAKVFPYMKPQQISRLLRQLEFDDKVLLSGNYNKYGYDKTKWYTFTDEFILNNKNSIRYQTLVKNLTMEDLKFNNGTFNSKQPIPDIDTDIDTYKSLSKDKQEFLQNSDNFINDSNSYSVNDNDKPLNKKPIYLSSTEYKIIDKYNSLLKQKMTLPTEKNDYKTTKEIKSCLRKMTSLINGTYLKDYPIEDLNETIREKLDKPLTIFGLEELIDKSLENYTLIQKGNYFPQNKEQLKINLNKFLYNEYSGKSWFTYCLTEIKPIREESVGKMRANLNTNIVHIYDSLFKHKFTSNEEYNFLYNIKQTVKYINSYLNKVEDIYRWEPGFINYFSDPITFCRTHKDWLKKFDDISPGHLKLTGAIGEAFEKFCLKKYGVYIKPNANQLQEISDKNTADLERNARIERNRKLQREQEEIKQYESLID